MIYLLERKKKWKLTEYHQKNNEKKWHQTQLNKFQYGVEQISDSLFSICFIKFIYYIVFLQMQEWNLIIKLWVLIRIWILWFPDFQTLTFNKFIDYCMSKFMVLTGKFMLVLYFVMFFITETLVLQEIVDYSHSQLIPCMNRFENTKNINQYDNENLWYETISYYKIIFSLLTKILLFIELISIIYSSISFNDMDCESTLNEENKEKVLNLINEKSLANDNQTKFSFGQWSKTENKLRYILMNSILHFALRKGKGYMNRRKNSSSKESKSSAKFQFTVMSLDLRIEAKEGSEISCPNWENVVRRRDYKLRTNADDNMYRRSKSIWKKDKINEDAISDNLELNRWASL